MKSCVFLLAAFVCLTAAQPANAQLAIGPQLTWSDDADVGLGGRAEFGLAWAFGIEDGILRNLIGMASGTYFFWNCPTGVSCSLIELNPNAAIPVELGRSVALYGGGGVHLARWSQTGADFRISDTQAGLNLLGGIKFPLAGRAAFAEGKSGFVGAEHFSLSIGLLFGGSRSIASGDDSR